MNSFENHSDQSVVCHWMTYGQFVKTAAGLVLGRTKVFYISCSRFPNCIKWLFKILCNKILSIPIYCNEQPQALSYCALPVQWLSHSKSCVASTAGMLIHSRSMHVLKIHISIKAVTFLRAIKFIPTVISVL